MQKIVDAVYEGGMLRPLNPLPLREQQQVRLIVETEIEMKFDDASGFFTAEEWEFAKQDSLSLADLHESLISIEDSLSGAVIEARRNERS